MNRNNQPKQRSTVATGLFCIAGFFFIVGLYYLGQAYFKS